VVLQEQRHHLGPVALQHLLEQLRLVHLQLLEVARLVQLLRLAPHRLFRLDNQLVSKKLIHF
jgi:hypothetical protein